MNKEELISFLQIEDIKKLFKEIGVKHLYLVGSYSRWDNNENSDIDLVYKKDDTSRVWGLSFIKNKMILEKKLNKKIDLVNEKYIYENIKWFIEKDKILIY